MKEFHPSTCERAPPSCFDNSTISSKLKVCADLQEDRLSMASSREVVWIVGDSHVFWLGQFVAATEVRFSGSLLECVDCQIAFHGYRGGTVASLAGSRDLKRKLAGGVPSVCVLSVGGNDLDHVGPPQTLQVGMRLYYFAQELVNMGVNRVVICQVVRRQNWRQITYE